MVRGLSLWAFSSPVLLEGGYHLEVTKSAHTLLLFCQSVLHVAVEGGHCSLLKTVLQLQIFKLVGVQCTKILHLGLQTFLKAALKQLQFGLNSINLITLVADHRPDVLTLDRQDFHRLKKNLVLLEAGSYGTEVRIAVLCV